MYASLTTVRGGGPEVSRTARMAAELAARAIETALGVLNQTFWIAGVICLLAIVPCWWLRATRDRA